MIRINLLLLLALVFSAFYLVHVQYESRRLYTQIDRAHAKTHQLMADQDQLQVQKRAEATSARIQKVAVQKLQMHPANPTDTQYVAYGSSSRRKDKTGAQVQP